MYTQSQFQFHLEERWDIDKCKGMIYQERLKIEVYYWVLIGGHICRFYWHNNG